MSVKSRLHDLIERLADDQANQALDILEDLVRDRSTTDAPAPTPLGDRMSPDLVSGADFVNAPPIDLVTLIVRQRVSPIASIDELRGDFWPEDESVDELVNTLRDWRRAGGYA